MENSIINKGPIQINSISIELLLEPYNDKITLYSPTKEDCNETLLIYPSTKTPMRQQLLECNKIVTFFSLFHYHHSRLFLGNDKGNHLLCNSHSNTKLNTTIMGGTSASGLCLFLHSACEQPGDKSSFPKPKLSCSSSLREDEISEGIRLATEI